MTHSQHRTPLRAIVTTLVTVALAGSLTACSTTGSTSTPGKAIPATGVDDGTTLKLWTRATVERQARKLVNAYNSSHKNQVDLTVVPFEDYVTKVGAAAGAGGLPDLFAADIVYIPNWVKQGLYQDITPHIDALAFKDKINQGHLTAGVSKNQERKSDPGLEQTRGLRHRAGTQLRWLPGVHRFSQCLGQRQSGAQRRRNTVTACKQRRKSHVHPVARSVVIRCGSSEFQG